jgi:uncharacterized RDD family membrane protein YckC
MQCSECDAVYSNELEFCPRCSVTAQPSMAARSDVRSGKTNINSPTENLSAGSEAKNSSTLIEFPRNGRTQVPAWRKELSERVREAQARKAREAELEGRQDLPLLASLPEPTSALGLVPPPEVNPIVAKALERIENARRTVMVSRSSGGAALAVARTIEDPMSQTPAPIAAPEWPKPVAAPVIEAQSEVVANDQIQPASEIAPPQIIAVPDLPSSTPSLFIQDQAVIVAEPIPTTVEIPPVMTVATAVDTLDLDTFDLPEPIAEPAIKLRRHSEPIIEDANPSTLARTAAGVLDFLLVVFATSPFAAVIELNGGDWSNPRVWGALAAIGAIVLVLYQASAVALSGKTWGMSALGLRVADIEVGMYPTFGQSLTRAFFYLLSLATLGSGMWYSFFNEDNLTMHDRISGTAVVRSE